MYTPYKIGVLNGPTNSVFAKQEALLHYFLKFPVKSDYPAGEHRENG
jgi:hypothetical protein